MKDKLKRAIIKFNTHPLPEKIFLVLFFLFFVFEALIVIVPFFTVLMNSLKSADEILSNPIAFFCFLSTQGRVEPDIRAY